MKPEDGMTDVGCSEAETTLLFAFGEAPVAHASHIAACSPCQGLLDEQRAVLTAAAGLGQVADRHVTDRPQRRRWVPWAAGVGLALAAAAVMWVVTPTPRPPEPPQTIVVASNGDLPLDAALDALDLDLLSLEMELR